MECNRFTFQYFLCIISSVNTVVWMKFWWVYIYIYKLMTHTSTSAVTKLSYWTIMNHNTCVVGNNSCRCVLFCMRLSNIRHIHDNLWEILTNWLIVAQEIFQDIGIKSYYYDLCIEYLTIVNSGIHYLIINIHIVALWSLISRPMLRRA